MKVKVDEMRGNLKDFVYSNIITSLFAFGGGVSFLPFFQEYYLIESHLMKKNNPKKSDYLYI